MALAMLAALQTTAHKEERFLYPVVVLLVPRGCRVARCCASCEAPPRGRRWQPWPWRRPSGPPPSVDLRGDQFRALVRATRPPEVTGLLIVNEGLWGAGGFFYVGKRIPWLTCDWPHDGNFVAAMRDPRFNRAITFEERALAELEAAGFHVVGKEGRETVLAR
jgi:hypothetical protein